MSEKRSWDIQPKRRPQVQQPARIERTPVQPSPARPVQKPRPKPIKISAKPRPRQKPPEPIKVIRQVRKEKIPQGKEREPLKERRKRARKRLQIALSILVALLIIVFLVIVWLPGFRIQQVQAAGAHSDEMQSLVLQTLHGTVDYVLPKDSIVFFPQDALRSAILAKYPDVSAVSISRVSTHSIGIATISRETAFLWCGETYGQPNAGNTVVVMASTSPVTASSTAALPSEPSLNCYDADSEGYVYVAAPAADLSADLLHVYGTLQGPSDAPLGERITGAEHLTNELEFVKAIKSLGVPIVTLALRGDEADLYAQSGTRITYVIGQEQAAAQLAQSAFPSLNFSDGTLEYVDLRFAGKVYYKVKGTDAQSANAGQ